MAKKLQEADALAKQQRQATPAGQSGGKGGQKLKAEAGTAEAEAAGHSHAGHSHAGKAAAPGSTYVPATFETMMESFGVNLQRKTLQERFLKCYREAEGKFKVKEVSQTEILNMIAEAGQSMQKLLQISCAESSGLKNQHNQLFLSLMDRLEYLKQQEKEKEERSMQLHVQQDAGGADFAGEPDSADEFDTGFAGDRREEENQTHHATNSPPASGVQHATEPVVEGVEVASPAAQVAGDDQEVGDQAQEARPEDVNPPADGLAGEVAAPSEPNLYSAAAGQENKNQRQGKQPSGLMALSKASKAETQQSAASPFQSPPMQTSGLRVLESRAQGKRPRGALQDVQQFLIGIQKSAEMEAQLQIQKMKQDEQVWQLSESHGRRPLVHYPLQYGSRRVSDFGENSAAFKSNEASGWTPGSVGTNASLAMFGGKDLRQWEQGAHGRQASVPQSYAEHERFELGRAVIMENQAAGEEADQVNQYPEAEFRDERQKERAGQAAFQPGGVRYLHSVHANRRQLRPILQPVLHSRRPTQLFNEEPTRSSITNHYQSTMSHVGSSLFYNKPVRGGLHGARSLKPQVNLNRKSEVYHTQKNMELLKLCEQPAHRGHAAQAQRGTPGQPSASIGTSKPANEPVHEKTPIFSVKMQSFDKTFQDGFNSYLKIGEQAVSVNDVSMRQSGNYVDHGQFGQLYERNFKGIAGEANRATKPNQTRSQAEARAASRESQVKERAKVSQNGAQQRDPKAGNIELSAGEKHGREDPKSQRMRALNAKELGVFVAQDPQGGGQPGGPHVGPRQGAGQGATQVVQKLGQSSNAADARVRQSVGLTKSTLGSQNKEHHNKDLVQLELTINSSPYKAADNTSRQNRAGAAQEGLQKNSGGMHRNSSQETQPIQRQPGQDGLGTSSRLAHGSNDDGNASRSAAYQEKDEAATEESPRRAGPASASQGHIALIGSANARGSNLGDDSEENKLGKTEGVPAAEEGPLPSTAQQREEHEVLTE